MGAAEACPSPSRTRLDTAPVEVLAEVNDDLERAVRSLTVELADLKATLAGVRLAFATDRYAGARAAKSATETCRAELRIDAELVTAQI
jgi:hypothetical protein